MVPIKSLDLVKIIAAMLHDVQTSYGVLFDQRACNLTVQKVRERVHSEGLGFLTKTLPSLGRAFDKAISGAHPLDASVLGFKTQYESNLPVFLGEFIGRVLQKDGSLLQNPCEHSVSIVRQVCYLFYKYELPYECEQEREVLAKFERTEQEILTTDAGIDRIFASVPKATDRRNRSVDRSLPEVAREARILLSRLFASFDPKAIVPSHGPGAVSTKERLWNKFRFTKICDRIAEKYPVDEYFFSSLGHVCDEYKSIAALCYGESYARVILVPKDSRGPRLISCEPLDFQWIQQGLSRAIVELVESHELTEARVNFTNQTPNRIASLFGSRNGLYATLDLNEASDRVSLSLVRNLFPPHIVEYLECCRTTHTQLPDGRLLPLRKFAPMGSSLCFPILALTVWALSVSALIDTDAKERILVYGDDVITPTACAERVMSVLESFGLKINRDKSCTAGLFRESCGLDAFNGRDVTPVRLRTVWDSSPSPSVYTSWIAYANQFYDRRYYRVYDYIVDRLASLYGEIPADEDGCNAPSLREVPSSMRRPRIRTNASLQKRERLVWVVESRRIEYHLPGWLKLLRYFTEGSKAGCGRFEKRQTSSSEDVFAFDASSYTRRNTSMLVKRWR